MSSGEASSQADGDDEKSDLLLVERQVRGELVAPVFLGTDDGLADRVALAAAALFDRASGRNDSRLARSAGWRSASIPHGSVCGRGRTDRA